MYMSTTKDMASHYGAYCEGWEAREEGRGMDTNPYEGTVLSDYWLEGFRESERLGAQ